MQKWEYMSSVNVLEEVSNFDKRLNMGKFEEPLNSKGKEGWELVSANQIELSSHQIGKGKGLMQGLISYLCIWKRPRVHSGKLSAEELEKLR